MILSILKFVGQLALLLLLTFAVHYYMLYDSLAEMSEQRVFLAYIINYTLAIFIYVGILFLEKKHQDLLGFSFMGGSLLKMLAFFIFFSGFYRADGEITKIEVAAFMIPYTISLLFETTILIRRLNK